MTRRVLLMSLAAPCWAAASQTNPVRTEKVILLGDSRVRILVAEAKVKGRKALIYFHPHENEHGSAVVTRHAIREAGGRLVEIRSQGEELVTFRLKGVSYSFDPNRMFTEAGLESSLAHFAPIAPAPLECARKLRNAVLDLLGNGNSPIVAVHNNALGGMNAHSFDKGGSLQFTAAKVSINPNQKPDNFFLVLDEELYTRLHRAGFNAVLQSPNRPDDGSLAVFCQQHHWTYISVEALESDMNQQERMLDALAEALGV